MSEGARGSALEFLGSLAGGLVHEIKNPLSTVRINLTLLREDLEASHPEERALLSRMRANSASAAACWLLTVGGPDVPRRRRSRLVLASSGVMPVPRR